MRNCYFPKDDWQELPDNQKHTIANQYADLKQCFRDATKIICGFSISQSIYDFFWNDIQPHLGSTVFYNSEKLRVDLISDLTQQVLDDLSVSNNLNFETIRSFDLTTNPPGANSTAYDFDCDEFLGLHIDNHDKLPINERKNGFKLLCLNLGKSPRYIQFLPPTVEEIIMTLGISKLNHGQLSNNISRLTDMYLSKYSNLPVFRIEIPPRHAYIATTQNLIHDGATNSENFPDLALLIGGQFTT